MTRRHWWEDKLPFASHLLKVQAGGCGIGQSIGEPWGTAGHLLFILKKGVSLGHYHSLAPSLPQLFLMPSREIFSSLNVITSTIMYYLYVTNSIERKVNQPQSLPSGSLHSSRRTKPWQIAILHSRKFWGPQERDGPNTTRIHTIKSFTDSAAGWIMAQ